MATINWTGAVSSSFFNAGNWNPAVVPGIDDVVVIGIDAVPNTLAVGANAAIHELQVYGSMGITAGVLTVTTAVSLAATSFMIISNGAELVAADLSISVGCSLGVNAGGKLTLSGHAIVNEGLTIAGIGTIDPALNGTAIFRTLQIDAGAIVENDGIAVINNTSDQVDSFGVFQNDGYLNLAAGALNAALQNNGQVNVLGKSDTGAYRSDPNSLLSLSKQLVVHGAGEFSGAVSVTLGTALANGGNIYVGGMLSIGLSSLTLDTSLSGALAEGAERTIFTAGITAMDAFSVANYAVTGQHADFAYALQLTGLDDAVGGLNLIALNDGATGGTAILADSATARDITLSIDSDTGRGTVRGGSFADLHNSLLHGVDEVRSGSGDDVLTVSSGLAGFKFVANGGEDVLTGGRGRDTLLGGGGDDTIGGGSGNDSLDGGFGRDSMSGGLGSDIYVVNATGDLIVELLNQGTDLVRSSASFTLSAHVENAIATGSNAITLTGNAGQNRLTGNAADNRLSGLDRADTLIGAAGNDTLLGGAGADTLTGGVGNDILNGGAASDRFVFARGWGQDRVQDFAALGSQADKIDLSADSRITGFADLSANHMAASGANVLIRAGTDLITLVNVRLSDLDASDFIF